MILENVGDILSALPDARMIGSPAARRRRVDGIRTDSRSLKSSELFVALVGEHFDGHDYVAEAARRRASAAIVSQLWAEGRTESVGVPLIVVPDTLAAYGRLAAVHRAQFDIPVVAIAGSNGKTTTKDLLAELLAVKFNILTTEGNLNNLIGAPATLLRLNREYEAAVIEIGTNTPGEIARLSQIVQPTHGVITNIGREHLELLGDLEGVAQEEGALFRWLAAHGGRAFVNLDDPQLARISGTLPDQVTFGSAPSADVQGRAGNLSAEGAPALEITDRRGSKPQMVTAQLRTPGVHSASNALAASAVALSFGVGHEDIRQALERFEPRAYSAGYARLAVVRTPSGVTVLNDTYNSNPDSVVAALDTLRRMKPGREGRRIAVLGDMLELGASSVDEHARVGTAVAEAGVDAAFFFGPETRAAHEALSDAGGSTTSRHFTDKKAMIELLERELRDGDLLLVKGSRGMKMEEVVARVLGGNAP